MDEGLGLHSLSLGPLHAVNIIILLIQMKGVGRPGANEDIHPPMINTRLSQGPVGRIGEDGGIRAEVLRGACYLTNSVTTSTVSELIRLREAN